MNGQWTDRELKLFYKGLLEHGFDAKEGQRMIKRMIRDRQSQCAQHTDRLAKPISEESRLYVSRDGESIYSYGIYDTEGEDIEAWAERRWRTATEPGQLMTARIHVKQTPSGTVLVHEMTIND